MNADHAPGGPDCCGACSHAGAVARGEIAIPAVGAPIPCPLDAAGAPVGLTLVLVDGRSAPTTVSVRQRIVKLGRSNAADIVVRMEALSRLQCRFEFGPEGVFVEDLQSTCGTYVDGKQVRRAQLHRGQRVQVANLWIEVRESSC